MQQLDKIESKLDSLATTQSVNGNRLTAIEIDLRYHILRSDRLEQIVRQHERYFWWAMGAISLVGPVVSKLLEGLVK